MKTLLIALILFTGCAGARPYTSHVQIPPRLVLKPAPACNDVVDLEPLPFRKHILIEIDLERIASDAADAARRAAHPEREALENEAFWEIRTFVDQWSQL